jgi:hypothetical protein
MREEIQCLIEWIDSIPSDEKAHRILRVIAEESLLRANLAEEKRRFTNKDIVFLAREDTTEPNKWVDWNNSVLPYWNMRKNQVIELAKNRGLNSYPNLDYHISKGGRGNESCYWLKAVQLPEVIDENEEQQSIFQSNKATRQTSVHYEIVKDGGVKTTWGAKWLFGNGQIRLSIWHVWAIVIWLLIIGGAAAFSFINWIALSVPKPVTTRELLMILSIFAFPSAIWILVIRPWVHLFDDRIVLAPELLVAIKVKPAQLELFRDADLRLIRLVRYSAPCPICGATIYLDGGAPDYPRRLVGRCYDSPREHIFSFDRVTCKGNILRAPIN